MRQLFPPSVVGDVDPRMVYAADDRTHPDGRPWLVLNMIASLDGATAIDSTSGGLGGPADKTVFSAIRALPDVILVAAGTVRAEHYGPPRPTAATRASRKSRGQSEVPRLAIVTNRLDLDLDTDLFTESAEPPIIITSQSSDPIRRAAIAERTDLLAIGDDHVDLPGAVRTLGSHGAGVILAEGGPSLNGVLVAHGLVDELCLSVSPMLVGGHSARVAHGEPGQIAALALAHILEADGLLFLCYRRAPS